MVTHLLRPRHAYKMLHVLSFLLLMLYGNLHAQLVCTGGKQITFGSGGQTHSYCAYYVNSQTDNYGVYLSSHPNTKAFVVEAANGTYNCHAFAFAVDKTVWVQVGSGAVTDPPMIYYNTGYYQVVANEKDAELVVYGNPAYPTHSALKITYSSNAHAWQTLAAYPQAAGWYVSKWDGGQLVVHPLTDCPYYSGTVTFYKKATDAAASNKITTTNVSITGGKLVCSAGSTFTLSCGTPKSFTVTWSCSPNISLPANPTAYPITLTANGNGPGYVKATLNFLDGTSQELAQYPVWVGVPAAITSISSSQFAPGPGTSHTYTVSQFGAYFYAWPFQGDVNPPDPVKPDAYGATSYLWTCSSEAVFTQASNNLGRRYTRGIFSNPCSCVITAQAINACGSVQYPQSIYVTATGTLKVSPNPASSTVTVSIITPETVAKAPAAASDAKYTAKSAIASTPTNGNYNVRIMDMSGVVRLAIKKAGKAFTIPVDKLQDGVYILEVSDGQYTQTEKLLIQH